MKTFIKIYVLLYLLIWSHPLLSQVPLKDHVTDTVKCRSAAGQSYALFVPAGYDNKKAWPLILIFDPAARGTICVNVFAEAGRKYGFILACSNNSRNGPLADNLAAATAMLKDLTGRFNLDQKRIYASGFSGGSRFAMTFAATEKSISGVIGCGAGLPGDMNSLPLRNSGFVYYGFAGNRDMYYPEMYELSDFFNQTGVISYFTTFSGGHQWPSSDLITGAVEWLILQEMNMKILPADQVFISNIEKKAESLINSSLSTGNIIDAVRYMKAAVRDFSGTPFGSGMSRLLADSEKSSEYKTAIRKWNKMVASEQESKDKYVRYLGKIFSSGSIPDTASAWWRRETGTLTRLREKGSPENSQMASRLLNFISIACSEQGTSFYRNNYYNQAAFLFEICTLSDNENPGNYYNLARSLARSGKLKKSVEALAAAVSHGFSSREKITSDPAFATIRNENGYKELVARMK
jgi:dienelactone hydrolase